MKYFCIKYERPVNQLFKFMIIMKPFKSSQKNKTVMSPVMNMSKTVLKYIEKGNDIPINDLIVL